MHQGFSIVDVLRGRTSRWGRSSRGECIEYRFEATHQGTDIVPLRPRDLRYSESMAEEGVRSPSFGDTHRREAGVSPLTFGVAVEEGPVSEGNNLAMPRNPATGKAWIISFSSRSCTYAFHLSEPYNDSATLCHPWPWRCTKSTHQF